jgi:IPT/TIG domain-containing protein
MSRSQIHKVKVQWTSSSGALFEEGALSPAVLLDTGTYTPPVGPAGGPLKGSSLAGPAPASIPIPTVASLSPNTAVIGGADLVMTVTGTNFLTNSTIFFNHGAEKTTYISPTQLSTVIKPSLAGTAGSYPVEVSNVVHKSNASNFTFTVTGEEPEDAPGTSERTLPLGPFTLLRVEPAEGGGVWYVLDRADGDQIMVGDNLLVEATGSSLTNGEFTVTDGDIDTGTAGETSIYREGVDITAEITAKGRITVT